MKTMHLKTKAGGILSHRANSNSSHRHHHRRNVTAGLNRTLQPGAVNNSSHIKIDNARSKGYHENVPSKTQSVYKRINIQTNLQHSAGHRGILQQGITGLGRNRVSSIPSLGVLSGKEAHQMSNAGSSQVSASMRASFLVNKPVLHHHHGNQAGTHTQLLSPQTYDLGSRSNNTHQSKVSVAMQEVAAFKSSIDQQ